MHLPFSNCGFILSAKQTGWGLELLNKGGMFVTHLNLVNLDRLVILHLAVDKI